MLDPLTLARRPRTWRNPPLFHWRRIPLGEDLGHRP